MTWPPTPRPLGMTLDVVGVGEAMLLLQAVPPDTLATATHLAVDVAGAEFNVCAAVARLGGRSALLTRVGRDAPGQRVIRAARKLGISDESIVVDSGSPTGIFLRETPADGSRRVTYYRTGSAASTLSVVDADRLWEGVPPRAIVLSGVTAALGPSLRDLIGLIAAHAADHGTAVVVDANLRPQMGSLTESVATLQGVLASTDLLVLGDDESVPLLAAANPDEVFAAAMSAGVKETVLKGGDRGCWYQSSTSAPEHLPSMATDVIDPIGAGDAFLGGYLGARLSGATPRGAALLGSQLAAAVIGAVGDTAGLPSAQRAQQMLSTVIG